MSSVCPALLDRIPSRGARVARGAVVSDADPFVHLLSARAWAGDRDFSVPITRETLGNVDGVVIVTDHRTVGHDTIADWADLVVDARDAVKRRAPHVVRLGAPAPVLVQHSDAEAAVAQAG